MLSLRRTLAVRNALLQDGLLPGQIVMGAVGDQQTANDTRADDCVDIAIIPVQDDRPDGGEGVVDMAPQYFR